MQQYILNGLHVAVIKKKTGEFMSTLSTFFFFFAQMIKFTTRLLFSTGYRKKNFIENFESV